MTHTPLRIGDRVHNPVRGTGTVAGFMFPEGQGESVQVVFDMQAPDVENITRGHLTRVIREDSERLTLGK